VLAVLFLFSIITEASQCPVLPASLVTGGCQTYPANGNLCSRYIGGASVYIAQGMSIPILDSIALKMTSVLQINRGSVGDECRLIGDAFICNSIFMSCKAASATEGIPTPPCQSYCEAFWKKCQAGFDAFYTAAILALGQPKESFSFPHCGPKATFTADPQPQDVFGVRPMPGLGPFPVAFTNLTRYPPASLPFKLLNNSQVTVQCLPTPSAAVIGTTPLDVTVFGQPIQCPFPLIDVDGDCKIPCPFPVIPVDQQDQIGLAFVVPALIALFFCLFVFADSLFVIAESQGFNELIRRPKQLMSGGGSASDLMSTDDATSTGVGSGKSGSRRRRQALRAATLYSLLGAVLGIIYFFIGPMITLIRKSQVSCGVDPRPIDLLNLILGNAETSDSFCKAQRVAPFILQMVFNLILYAIVRVFMVVTERSRRMSEKQLRIFDILLVSYCAGIPILFLIIASARDQLSTNLIDFITQFSRNSAICVPRLTVAEEVILIFLPFIVTGIMICALSYYIYTHLQQINQNVQGLMSENKTGGQSSSAVALRLLMVRLSFLGIFTFLILMVFISASATLMQAMSVFSPRFNNFFLCQSTQATTCKTCDAERALMLDKLPPSSAFGAQIAAMSSITLLFGAFFAAQSISRLYKEYQDGTLKIKIYNLWYGRKIAQGFQSFSPMVGETVGRAKQSFSVMPETVKESFTSLWYGRFRRWRKSMRYVGRSRGPVFRWQKGKPVPAPRKTGFPISPPWAAPKSPEELEKEVQWQGIVGVPNSQGQNPTGWTADNASFAPSAVGTQINPPASPSAAPPKPPKPTSPGAAWTNTLADAPSWGYSESKLNSAENSFEDVIHASNASSYSGIPGSSIPKGSKPKPPPGIVPPTLPEI
jgi:hypothetical protein